MISAKHAEAMQAGRERQLAEAQALRDARHAAYSQWVRLDARLWRAYKAAAALDPLDCRAAYEEWKANLDAMPSLTWAPSA